MSTALVTGGRRGLGRAIAIELARAGFDVAITDLERDADAEATLDAIARAGARGLFIEGDIAELDRHDGLIGAVVEGLGGLDCLVNNAGIASPVRGDVLELEPANFDRVVAVNLRAPLFLAQRAARWMLAHPSGTARSIVNVTSVNAELAAVERADYSVAKAGLAMAGQVLALRLAEAGIAVFEVRPGIIRTSMTARVKERYDRLIADGVVPMRRWGEPEDVARVVAGLASGAFAFATGSVIEADGGLAIHRL
jgi:3-oxoacyl-[acyl-carrier protein] reductase